MNNVRMGAGSREPYKGKSLLAKLKQDIFLNRVDFVVWLVWGVAMTLFVNETAALRYLMAFYFAAGLFIFYRQMMPVVVACWPMFVLPLLFMISALWAPSAVDAIRKGLLFALTSIIGIYIAQRLTPRQIIYTSFGVTFVAGILSIANPDYVGLDATGIFDQKNVLAIVSFFLVASSYVLMCDRGINGFVRILGLLGIPIGIWLIIISHSATTLVLTILIIVALTVQVLFWGPMRKVRHLRTLVALVGLVLVSMGIFALFGIGQFDAVTALLEAMGKDTTLTGRTGLWDQANRIIEQHPLTGMGANGFWRPEVGQANSILRAFYYDQFTKFSFHNSYLENGVQLGYPGVVATYFLGYWCGYRSLRTWILNQNLFNAYFMFVALMIIVRSNTEIDLAGELGMTLITLLICAGRTETRQQREPASRPAGPPAPATTWRVGSGAAR